MNYDERKTCRQIMDRKIPPDEPPRMPDCALPDVVEIETVLRGDDWLDDKKRADDE